MTRSARLLAAAIARSRTAVGAATAAPLLPTTGALAAASPPLLSPPLGLFHTSRRDQPSPPTSLDWAKSYAKGARGGGGGKKGGGGGGGGGGKKGKRGGRPVNDEDDEDEEDDDDAEQSGDEEDADDDPLKLDEVEGMMKAALEHYSHELAGVRTGRANPGLIENLPVLTESPPSSSSGGGGGGGGNDKSHHQPQQHGHAHVPLRALGTVTVRDPQTLAVSVYDPAMAGAVARAIQNSPLGLSAVAGGGDGTTGGKKQQQSSEVLVRLPRMTREVVERMVKLVHAEGEGALVSIRRARQKALDAAKRAYGGGGGGGGGGNKSSDLQRAEKAVAALVEKYNGEVERMKKLKDKELREHRD